MFELFTDLNIIINNNNAALVLPAALTSPLFWGLCRKRNCLRIKSGTSNNITQLNIGEIKET